MTTSETKSHVCAECGRIFTAGGGLTFHLIFHKPKQICCDICADKFYLIGHLRAHLVTVHTRLARLVIVNGVPVSDILIHSIWS